VIIAARADAWIEVTQNGSPVEKRMLHRGDRYTVPQGTGMTLRTGNAGGTQILFNGKTIQSLGANGDIAKGVSLNIQDLERRLAQ
jgi:cytoskeleton protein RodZ